MAEGGVQAPEPADTQSQPPTDGQQSDPARLPGGSLNSVWPVLVVPTIIIGLAALAGHLAGELATLAFGIATVAGLIGFLTYRILGRTRPWLISVCVCTVAIPLFGLVLIKAMATSGDPPLPGTAAPSVGSALPPVVNAGRRFTQQNISDVTGFRGADLRGTQLVGLDLRGIDFSGANAAGASFEGSRLDRAIFRGTDLGGAVLRRACLRNAVLLGADLTGAVATDADVSGVDLTPEETSMVTDWPRPSVRSSACT